MTDHRTPPVVPTDTPEPVRRHVAIVLASVLLTIQLIPTGLGDLPPTPAAPINTVVTVPTEVQDILERSCYDCHSQRTVVPWYGRIQPVGGWIAGHVRDGRRDLNFEEFGSYRPRRQFRKLEQIADEVRSEAMPLPSYLLMHGNARVSDADRAQLFAWVEASRATLQKIYPPDSLQRRR